MNSIPKGPGQSRPDSGARTALIALQTGHTLVELWRSGAKERNNKIRDTVFLLFYE
jgi:hypothetical protein